MTRRNQMRLILHGAIFIVFSTMVQAYPGLKLAFFHGLNDPLRQYFRQSHAILLATGMFMIATGGVLPLLELTEKWIATIAWSFVISGYTFVGAFIVLIVGLRLHPPDPSQNQWAQTMAIGFPLNWINIVLVGVSGATSFLPAVFIVGGAYRAMRHTTLDDIH
jgi:hypothetical protein